MSHQFENIPLRNSIFENDKLLQWFADIYKDITQERNFDIIDAVLFGYGPYDDVAFLTMFAFVDFDKLIDYDAPEFNESEIVEYKINTGIVGRVGWNEEALIDFVELHIANDMPCKIYSQEMLAAYAITGVDPFDAPREVLLAFAEGHPALQYLLDYTINDFDWPTMMPRSGNTSSFDYDLKNKGMLGAFGYSAGVNGKNKNDRHTALKRALSTPPNSLPHIENKESLRKWQASEANSCARLHLIAWYIWGRWNTNYPKYEKNPESYRQLIDDYESDLNWLKKKYYQNCKHRITWPSF